MSGEAGVAHIFFLFFWLAYKKNPIFLNISLHCLCFPAQMSIVDCGLTLALCVLILRHSFWHLECQFHNSACQKCLLATRNISAVLFLSWGRVVSRGSGLHWRASLFYLLGNNPRQDAKDQHQRDTIQGSCYKHWDLFQGLLMHFFNWPGFNFTDQCYVNGCEFKQNRPNQNSVLLVYGGIAK